MHDPDFQRGVKKPIMKLVSSKTRIYFVKKKSFSSTCCLRTRN